MATISVIGAGSWGTALALLLYKNGHKVTVWSIMKHEIEMLQREHEHKDKLPGVKLPEDMEFTTDLEKALTGKDVLVLAVPSPYTRSTSHSMAPFVKEGQIIGKGNRGAQSADAFPDHRGGDPAGRGGCFVRTVPCGGGWPRNPDDDRCRSEKERDGRVSSEYLYE